MPNTFSTNTFSSTYRDDYADSDNYYRILFNSGRALQARELTQLQTIIQSEVARFGRNIFKEGAAVNPGGPTVDTAYEFVKLSSFDAGTIVGTVFTGQTSNIEARVLEFVAASGSDPATVYVQYTSTKNSTATDTLPKRFTPGETLNNGSINMVVQSTNTISNPAIGRGTRFSCAAGDFFVRNHFVFAPNQSILLSKYTTTPTKVVGFKVTEDIVTAADTDALYDNTGVNPNLSSPGADRYRIRLTLTTQDLVDSDENFVYYCDVREGKIVDQVTGTEDYNKINDLLAQRTKEESGNYIVNPFRIEFNDDSANGDDTVLLGSVSTGLAYVNGYRAEAPARTALTFDKPRTTISFENQTTGIGYGQYFVCSSIKGIFPIDDFSRVNLSTSAADASGSIIGTARVRYVESQVGGTYKVYLFDINLTSSSVRNIRSVGTGDGTSTTCLAVPVLENSQAVLKESGKRNLLFALPLPRPDQFADVNFEVQQLFENRTASGSVVTLNTSSANDTFTSTSEWIVVKDSTGVVETGLTFGAAGGTSIQISGLSGATDDYTVYAKINIASGTGVIPSQTRIKTKTLTSVTSTFDMSTDVIDSGDISYLLLNRADIFEVDTIAQDSANGNNLSSRFELDNGQRPGFYDLGRLILRDGVTAPTGNVYVAFKHFTHTATGDFFCAQSYDGQVDYNRIPDFITGPRTKVNLRDVLDFRSTIGQNGTAPRTFSGTNASVVRLPANGDTFKADIDYYEPRNDRVVLNEEGIVSVIQGEAALTPQLPPEPENTITLFEVYHNAYGLNDSDISNKVIRAKRFTMKDISRLEERIDELEELTTLSLLETNTSTLLVLDSAGNPRTKAGFLVDNFADRGFTDTQSTESRSSIDPSQGILRPATHEDAVTLVWDSSSSSGVVLKGDNIYLEYNHTTAVSQTLMSGTENINPFAVITGEGHLTISPTSDEWMETQYIQENVIKETATEVTTINEGQLAFGTARGRGFGRWSWALPNGGVWTGSFGSSWGDFGWPWGGGWFGWWQWNWLGSLVIDNNGISQTNFSFTRNGDWQTDTRTFSQRIVTGSRTVREEIGDRTVSLTFLPWMRSRMIYFRAEGLRPDTQYFPFFNNVKVSAFCRGGENALSETFQRVNNNSDNLLGRTYAKATGHPRGSVDLISSNRGKIEGSFFLPSNNTLRFKAGAKEFKLLDISVPDDTSALSRASTIYSSQGTLDTRQKTIRSTRITEVLVRNWTEQNTFRWKDPLAQSFLVTNEAGMYLTKVDIYFKSKDTSIPVQLQIRPMNNGIPSSSEIVPGAVKFLSPSEVNTWDDAITSNPALVENSENVVANATTTFEFDEPIFLNPNTEYAVVLLAESTDYNVYVAETYAFQLGTTEKRVSRQPSMGSLFKSQNGSTWSPDQTKDLAFTLYRANFTASSGQAVFTNADMPPEPAGFATNSGDSDVYVYLPHHGFHFGETVVISGFDSGTKYNGILGSTLNGTQTITKYDGLGFEFQVDSAATASGTIEFDSDGQNFFSQKQRQFDIGIPVFEFLTPEDTNVSLETKVTSGRSLAGIISEQTKYQKDTSYRKDVINLQENFFAKPQLIATAENETANLGAGVRSLEFKVNLSSSRTNVSPVIDTQRLSFVTVSNIIDNPDSTGTLGREFPLTTGGFNTPIIYSAETSPNGGTAMAKHVTVPVTLEEDAVGLKVLIAAQRPVGSEFDLYWRTAIEGEVIFDKAWTYQAAENEIAADPINFREYRYLVGGDGGDMTPFSQYQLKIVMRSNNSAAVPTFRDLRAIAMAT